MGGSTQKATSEQEWKTAGQEGIGFKTGMAHAPRETVRLAVHDGGNVSHFTAGDGSGQ